MPDTAQPKLSLRKIMLPEEEAQADAGMLGIERRDEQRSRQFKGGKVIFGDGKLCLDCVVRNLSAEGARLRFPSQVAVPAQVDLIIPVDCLSYSCEVMWHDMCEIGVRFLSAPTVLGEKRDLKEIFVD